MRRLLAIILLAAARAAAGDAPTDAACLLARGGTALASIVVPDDATPVERTAAEELRVHLDLATGARFAVTNEAAAPDGARILVGNTAALRALLPGFDARTLAEDGIVLKTAGDRLFLTGHPRRGPLYAAYALLEDEVGVRWWTADETFVPRRPTLPMPALDVRYEPALRFRETYYLGLFDARFRARLRGNFSSRTRYMLQPLEMIPESYGGNHRLIFFKGRNSAYHSFYELIPPAAYFGPHPEWFSEIRGKRTCRDAQLCLTNDEMREQLTRNALALLREDPGADIIQVSQNDCEGRCTCPRCLAVEAEEGGAPSGPLLRFVNRVAEDLAREFPGVYVETFAYQYTRRPPARARPRDNVLIRLCSIECSFLQPLDGDAPANRAFARDVAAWGAVAGRNLFGWDYVTDFSSYLLPHPNLRALAPNVRFFVRHGATGLFEQGDALCAAGDFVRLRAWVLAHLLWNPGLDEDRLVDAFLAGYYGPRTGAALKRYLTFLQDRAQAADPALTCYESNVTKWLDFDGVTEATRLMDAALAAAGEEEAQDPAAHRGLRDKVRRERLPLDHVWLLNYWAFKEQAQRAGRPFLGPADPVAGGRAWIDACARFGVQAHRETTTAETFKTYQRHLLKSLGAPPVPKKEGES